MDEGPIYSRPDSHKLTRMVHVEDEFMTCTSSEEANAKLGTNSAVAIAEYPSASNSQPIGSHSCGGSDSSSWSHQSNTTSSAQHEQSDPQANIVTSALATPEKPATLDNAKVLLRKADKLLSGKMARSHSQGEEGSETLISPSSPWSSPSSNESEDDLKKARGLLRAAHNMIELVGSKKNDKVWKRGRYVEEEGSLDRSAQLDEKDIMDWEAETVEEQGCVAELRGRISDLEAQLRDVLADLDSEREVTKELQERLRLNASDYWDKLPKLSPKKKTVRFHDSGTGTQSESSHHQSPGPSDRALDSVNSSDLTVPQQQTAGTQAQSGCINTTEKQSKDQVDRDERMIAALREHSASLDKHTAALERHTAAMKEQTRSSGDI
ncbi:hypothetical protein KCU99_g9624, partial [Aureobasidium melanogenum]